MIVFIAVQMIFMCIRYMILFTFIILVCNICIFYDFMCRINVIVVLTLIMYMLLKIAFISVIRNFLIDRVEGICLLM